MKNPSNILAVDTSSQLLSMAISKGNSIFETNLSGTPRHSEHLIDLMEHGLGTLQLKKEDLTHFLWGLGPGSFTGLRIGLAMLKGFSLGFNKPCFGVSSLDIIARGSGVVNGDLLVCVDARRERIYTAAYHFEEGKPKRTLADSLFSADQLIKYMKSDCTITGDAIKSYGELIKKSVIKSSFQNDKQDHNKCHPSESWDLPLNSGQIRPLANKIPAFAGMTESKTLNDGQEQIGFMTEEFWYPKASFMIKHFQDAPQDFQSLSIEQMQPIYLKESEAEENLKLGK